MYFIAQLPAGYEMLPKTMNLVTFILAIVGTLVQILFDGSYCTLPRAVRRSHFYP